MWLEAFTNPRFDCISMAVPTDEDNNRAVTCTDCQWLAYVADATTDGDKLVCPDCASELKIA